jgi:hypothetical protein
MKKFGALRTIVTAGLVVGVLDILSALVIWWQRGVALQRGLQGIAAGLLGAGSYEGGMATVGLGLALHFFVTFVVVSIFYLASRRIAFLTKQPCFRCGLRDWRLHCDVLVRVTNDIRNISTPAL